MANIQTYSQSSTPATLKPKSNPAHIYLSSLAPSGRRSMTGRINQVALMLGQSIDTMPWHELRYQHLEAIRTKLMETELAPSTINMTLYAIRGIAKSAFNLELMSADDYTRLCSVKPVNGATPQVSQPSLLYVLWWGFCQDRGVWCTKYLFFYPNSSSQESSPDQYVQEW